MHLIFIWQLKTDISFRGLVHGFLNCLSRWSILHNYAVLLLLLIFSLSIIDTLVIYRLSLCQNQKLNATKALAVRSKGR